MTATKAILAGVLAAGLGSPAAAALTPAEKTMVAEVTRTGNRSIALLQRLVEQNSGSLNIAGVTRVAEMVRPELEALGFAVTWKPLPQTGRAGHLIAVNKGRPGGKRLLLIGHLDTVFEPDAPFQAWKRDGDTASGPGIGDDKGGIVVMLAALGAMQAAGTLKDAAIEIVLTGDEERVGSPVDVARADLVEAARRADVALDFEGLARENGQDMGSIARRSSNTWALSTTGKSGHSSGIFSDRAGNGAIYELTRIIAAFRAELPEPSLTFNVGLVSGGDTVSIDADGVRAAATGKPNIIPAAALARGDFRTLSAEQTARVRARMQAIVARHLPGTDAQISFSEGYPPMAPTAASRALLVKLNSVNADLGLPEMAELDPLKRGAGDIGFVARYVPGLNGLGTGGSGAHAPGETVDLTTIPRQARRAAILMSRLAREPR